MTESEAIRRIKECRNTPSFQPWFYMNEALNMAITALEEIQEYRAIGTVSEFRELKEKATAIKALGSRYSWDCPCCGTFHSTNGKYCSECGQAVEFD